MPTYKNYIAHQDYPLQERINLVENPGFLYYANGGSFIPGSIQKAIASYVPQRHYRNECLCNTMVNFNMIDIVGRGIRKIFNQQWERRFPTPDYEIDAVKKEVAVLLYGNAINEKYTKLLKETKVVIPMIQTLEHQNESYTKWPSSSSLECIDDTTLPFVYASWKAMPETSGR